MEKLVYELWLHTCLGSAYSRVRNVLEQFDNAEQVYFSNETELRLSGAFTPAVLRRVLKKNTDFAARILERCRSLGHNIIQYRDDEYPETLRSIEIPPYLMFVKGRIPKHEGLKIAIVGTRAATRVGKQVSFEFAYNLSKNGALVVSGGAEGIDTAAHHGALQAGGNTVCVLGCGICCRYLMDNAALREQITRHGALISEFAPDESAQGYTFPRRNRIISALSDCTLVVEAGEGSGSLITAGDAAEQKKAIFAVPGSVDNAVAVGSNKLLAAGAKAAISYTDILNWYDNKSRTFVQQLTKDDVESIRTKKSGRNRSKITSAEALGAMEKTKENVPRKLSVPAAKPDKSIPVSKNIGKEADKAQNVKYKVQNVKYKAQNIKKTEELEKELLTENARTVYDTLSETPAYPDEICLKTGLDISEVLSVLTELEIGGKAEMYGFGKYKRK